MKNNLSCILAACLSISMVCCQAQTNTKLSAEAFEKGIHQPDSVQLLDVRTPGEYKTGHIGNALLADWNDAAEFNRRVAFINKQKPVYVYCLAGGRSAAAAKKLRESGFTEVYELTGGTNAWKAAGKPLESAVAGKQMSLASFQEKIKVPQTVLVDFGAEWCPPCKQMEPILSKLQETKGKDFQLVKVDGGNDEEVMQHYQVTSLPVFIIFRDGKEVWRKDGVASREELESHL